MQLGKTAQKNPISERINSTEIAHTFYLVGDAGNADQQSAQTILNQLKQNLDSANSKSTLLFLGDNIYPSGLPAKNDENRKLAEEKLDDQIALAKNYKGKTIFVPGNHDWYSNGIKGLKEQQNYVTEKLGQKDAFSPKNGCPIESFKITKEIVLITVDSEWYLADWSKNPGINEKCEIKTREDFFSEFESQLNKNQNKTIVIAIHHPLLDHGSHGGKFSWEKQIFPLENKIPLPIVGSFLNLVRETGGITHQDLSNQNYQKLTKRIKTLIANRNNVVVVSGHDHNLQYIEHNNIKQIISGAGSKSEAASAIYPNDFSYGKNGYAVLHISKSGNAEVQFFGNENGQQKLLFQKQVLENIAYQVPNFPNQFPTETTATVYDSELTKKNKIYQWLWGKNYRSLYSTPVSVPTLVLDTLYGGAKPNRSGGGHQTNSLRLDTPKGEYVIRGLKKSGVRFLQSVAFKDQYIGDGFEDGFIDKFLLDFYTSSNPFTPLAVPHLSQNLGIKSTQPQIFYVPKQNALGKFNQNFGDALYYLEVRPGESEEDTNPVFGTDEVIHLITKDEKYKMDEKAFIKARLFDMLIGDWDRHYDQWKWEQKKVGNDFYFSPIPKDRDQAFVKYDGFLTKLILSLPAVRHMQGFGPEIKNIKWFNMEPYPLDLAFTKSATEKEWIEQAAFIQNNLTEEMINEAFQKLPKEVQNEDIVSIKKYLDIRKKDLQKYAADYYKVLQKTVLLTGTDKDDKFVINRLPNGETEVKIFRLKKEGEELVFEKTYNKSLTQEIWIYGLADQDLFEVNGKENNLIKLRLIGGLDKDTYQINAPKKVQLYDYKSKENNFVTKKANKTLTDDYEINQYNYRKPKFNAGSNLPSIGFNPDDGFIIGLNSTYTKNGFKMNPNTAKHQLIAKYFFGSQGYQFDYKGTFPKLTGNWFYEVDAGYTSSYFIRNYFGMGNESVNLIDDDNANIEPDYYRVRAKDLHIAPSFNWKKNASWFFVKPIYEALEIEETNNRYTSQPGVVNPDVFETKHFGGLDLGFEYKNFNKSANPTLGMKLDAKISYRRNLQESDKNLPSFETGLGFVHYLTNSERFIISTYAKAKWLLSDDYEFYQMATLGGNNNLRGFRFDRFYGKNSFYQTTDLRLNLGNFKNTFLPVNVSIFGGFDYGRVWLPTEFSKKWHTSAGGGIVLSAVDMLALQISYFTSTEKGRLVFGLGMNF